MFVTYYNFPFCAFERQYKRHLADGVDFVRRYALVFLQRAFFILFFAFYYGSFVSANVKNVSVRYLQAVSAKFFDSRVRLVGGFHSVFCLFSKVLFPENVQSVSV